MDKRGFQLAVSTIVIMILAIVVLLFLVTFFTMGSGNFLNNIKGYFSYSNIDSVKQSCEVLVNSGQTSAFCCDVKTVKYHEAGEKMEDELSCSELVDLGIIKSSGLDCSEVGC